MMDNYEEDHIRLVQQARKQRLKVEHKGIKELPHASDGLGMCWCCGTTESITKQHVIPRLYHPLVNFLIPLCRGCHDKVDGIRRVKK